MKIKPLKTEFKTNGLHYFLVKRINDLALVCVKNAGGSVYGWEVHKIRTKPLPPSWKENGEYKAYTYYQSYASNEDFGRFGWSFATLRQVYDAYPQFKGCVDETD